GFLDRPGKGTPLLAYLFQVHAVQNDPFPVRPVTDDTAHAVAPVETLILGRVRFGKGAVATDTLRLLGNVALVTKQLPHVLGALFQENLVSVLVLVAFFPRDHLGAAAEDGMRFVALRVAAHAGL